MTFVSTRNTSGKTYSYAEVLLNGLAPDGGLYLPENLPLVSVAELESLKNQPYRQVALKIKHKLIGDDIPYADLEKLVNQAYANDKFPTASNENLTPIRCVKDNLFLQNLSLGPTAAFKDMAMQQLGQELNYILEKQSKNLTILGATSGDTGSAAEAAIKGLDRIKLFMLSPAVGMSSFQTAQMAQLSGPNIFNIAIEGRFDDCQDMVKEIKNSSDFAHLGAVNSINWGRISSQIPYYFSGYLQAVETVGELVDFCVPSGNFGNVLSGYFAKKMGLPIRNLIVATNENDVLHRLFTTGVYELTSAQITSSPSMDISKASNYERLAYEILGEDPNKVINYMQNFAQNGSVNLTDYGVSSTALAERGFLSGSSDHQQRLENIAWVYQNNQTVIDPHTADGIAVARQLADPSIKTICLETALPTKFEATVKEALGFIPARPDRFTDLEKNSPENAFTTLSTDREILKNFIVSH